MTQEPDRQPSSTHKRSSRAGRNRPMLITSTENELLSGDSSAEDAASSSADALETSASPNSTEAQSASSRRSLRGFFSTVGKSASGSQPAAKTPSSPAKTVPAKASEQKPAAKSQSTRPGASTRPAPLFKTRYLFGMIIYLLAADLIGVAETSLLAPYGGNSLLAQFSLFGLPIHITVSALVYLATLIIILIVLARFDLLPRSFKALAGGGSAPQNKRGSSSSNQKSASSVNTRPAPPTMKQGVKGSNDDLYQKYQASRRRERKK